MAGDTRDNPQPRGPPPGVTEVPSHIQSAKPKVYEVFHGTGTHPSSTLTNPSPSNPSTTIPENANALPPGSGQNTAGSINKKEAPSLTEAIKTVRIEDFKQVHMYPCVRESLLMGIGGGFGVGGVRALLGAPIPRAANWAVGAFVFASLGNYEFCLYRRSLERAHMKRAVEIIDRKKVEKEAEAHRKREERRAAKEEADRIEEGKRRKGNGWKFW